MDEKEMIPEGKQMNEAVTNTVKAVVTSEDVHKAMERMVKYKQTKQALDNRIIRNEVWWKQQHWDELQAGEVKEEESTTGWLFNTICNKHADIMDNYPEPSILPRAKDDEDTANTLSKIIPVILEQCNYEKVYSDTGWYKLKQGTGVKGIFWNKSKLNGLGDIDIKKIDILNLVWQPGVSDIQESSDLFNLELVDNEKLKEMYPDKNLNLGGNPTEIAKYQDAKNIDTSDKSVVIDWYYKKTINGKTVLHYVKFVGDTILYASENDPEYAERGFYDHGLYPFVFDPLFPEENSPCGFGIIDAHRSCQKWIDKLDQNIVENADIASNKRWFVGSGCSVNEDEYNDPTKKFIHVTGNIEDRNMKEATAEALPTVYVNILQNKIEELKETSGNRDFAQGGTASGVTAASAIAALMEAGSKMSRDQNKASYRALVQEVYLIVELIRQFYDTVRCFRITGKDNSVSYADFDNSRMIAQKQEDVLGKDMGYRLPVFDIKVSAAKKSTYSRLSQNELALQFYGQGFFKPELASQALMCLEMMDFDGKEKIMQMIQENKAQYEQQLALQQLMLQMQAAGMNGQTATPPAIVQPQGMSKAQQASERARNTGEPQ